jgi:hypothetical protein
MLRLRPWAWVVIVTLFGLAVTAVVVWHLETFQQCVRGDPLYTYNQYQSAQEQSAYVPALLSVTFDCIGAVLLETRYASATTTIFTVIVGIATALLAVATFMLAVESRVIERAYVSAEPLGILPFVRELNSFAQVGFKNAGRLPARRVRWRIEVSMQEGRQFVPRRVPIDEQEWRGRQGGVVVSGATVVQAVRIPANTIDDYLWEAFSRDKEFEYDPEAEEYIYVWGLIEYHDGFTTRHTRFCHRYFFRGFVERLDIESYGGLSAVLPESGARQHENGNEAD